MSNAISLQLGITSIGDLLIRKRVTRVRDTHVYEEVKLTIPNYQRPYKWTAKNAIQLLDDIVEAKKENKEVYRVGTLILHHDLSEQCYNIVDGQQRIITFTLLLKALGADGLTFLQEKLTDNPYTRKNIASNYRAFERRLYAMAELRTKAEGSVEKLCDDRVITELREFIEDRCELIVVVTNDISEAFQFFDSQNARGKKLYPHDLLKAYHLREMDNMGEAETEAIVKRWEDVNQRALASLFGEYLYRLREWVHDNRPLELDEHNIDKFKGISKRDNLPYAQYYKGAYAYADMINHSAVPFVSGMPDMRPLSDSCSNHCWKAIL